MSRGRPSQRPNQPPGILPAPRGSRRWHGRAASWARAVYERRMERHKAAVQAIRDTAAEAQRSKLPQMAAALSYRTVFGLIPVLVVALVAMKLFFTTEDQIADVLNHVMRQVGISSIAVPPAQSPEQMGPFPEEAPYQPPQSPDEYRAGGGSAGSTRPEMLPPEGPPATPEQEAVAKQSAERLDEWVRDLVRRVSVINLKAIGLIGVVALIYAAISMLVEVERSFNQIYRVPSGRSWSRRVVNYWALLTLGAIGLGASFYVTERFSSEVLEVAARFGAEGNTFVLGLVGYFTTVTISLLMFVLVYTVVPNTRVQFGAALAGAAVAALTWEASKWGFTQYLKFSTGTAKLYGSIALIPLFLLWVYVTWCIVLFGLEVAYYVQHGRHRTEAKPAELPAAAIVDPGATLGVLAAMARRFDAGKPVEAEDLATDTAIPAGIIRQMLARFLAAGLIHRVERPGDIDGEPAYALSRPPSTISAEEVVRLGEELTGASGRGTAAEAMRAARLAAARDRTLAFFLDAPPSPEPSPAPRADRLPA